MNRRTLLTVMALGAMIGAWGLLYGLTRALKPAPLPVLAYPERVSI